MDIFRWWFALWSAWGMLVAAVVLFLDGDPGSAAPWVLGGMLIGAFGRKAFRPFSSHWIDWYTSRNPVREERNRVMFDLFVEERSDPEELANRMSEDKELRRLYSEEFYWLLLAVPPLFGLFYGVLFGPVAGSLSSLDKSSGITASAGACLGLLIGPIAIAFLAGLALAWMVEIDRALPFRGRLARRALLVISPLFIAPALCHSVRRVFWRAETT